LKGDPNVVAGFLKHGPVENIPGDLFFYVKIVGRGSTYWYFPDTGNGYSDISLISMEDPTRKDWRRPALDGRKARPHDDETYFGFRADLTVQPDLPMWGLPASQLIFIPEFGPHVWYTSGTSDQGNRNRYPMPRAFFVLTRCG
jgi:hypothetical protein